MTQTPPQARLERPAGLILVVAVFLMAISGLVYELIAGALSSYLLGDSVTQFSLVIGLFLTAMGVGSFLSKFIKRRLLASLIAIEVAAGLVGGFTALVGFAAFSLTDLYTPTLVALIAGVGILVGVEIPLMVRILREIDSLRITLANVLSADYLGALAASVLFPYVLLPHLGLVRAGLLMGLMNVAVAGVVLWRFREYVAASARALKAFTVSAGLALLAGMVFSHFVVSFLEDRLYQDEVIYAADTSYQHVVITRWRDDVRLFLNGHLQFSSVDEYRYHEALVHVPMSVADRRANVLILGGGDGLAAREAARYADVERITVVDLDPGVTSLFRSRPLLSAINGRIFDDPRVHVVNRDAMAFLADTSELFDVILMDLPDPGEPGLAKLYSRAFFTLVGRHLAAGGAVGSQCASPFRSREAFWCIIHTLRAARWGPRQSRRLHAAPYRTVVPTFGTWGFVVAAERPIDPNTIRLTVPTRYLTQKLLPGLFGFPKDMAEVDTRVSLLNDPVVCHLYRRGYHKYLE